MTFERKNIHAMTGYLPGEQPTDGRTIKLNTNENPYPPSPAVQAAIAGYDARALRIYPPPTADLLRDQLANLHGATRDNIVITNGGDEGLRLAMTTFVEPGTVFAMATPSYSLYSVLARIQDAALHSIALAEDFSYPDDFAERLNNARARLTCIVNPHAPSGKLVGVAAVSDLAKRLQGVLLIDEAYVDFVDPELQYDALQLIEGHQNVLILRTFSKGYSLAGLRLGYLVGPAELIAPILTKTRDSYNVDHLSQTIGSAAVSDRSYAENTWRQVRRARATLRRELGDLGFQVAPSQANFLLVQAGAMQRLTACELYQELKERHILVRYFDAPMMRDKLRITVGTPAQNATLVAALREILVA